MQTHNRYKREKKEQGKMLSSDCDILRQYLTLVSRVLVSVK